MNGKLKNLVDYIGVSRLVVIGFLLLLMISVFPLGINPGMIYSDCLVRVGMNGFLVLSMMISIVCGAGLNFGLPSVIPTVLYFPLFNSLLLNLLV